MLEKVSKWFMLVSFILWTAYPHKGLWHAGAYRSCLKVSWYHYFKSEKPGIWTRVCRHFIVTVNPIWMLCFLRAHQDGQNNHHVQSSVLVENCLLLPTVLILLWCFLCGLTAANKRCNMSCTPIGKVTPSLGEAFNWLCFCCHNAGSY